MHAVKNETQVYYYSSVNEGIKLSVKLCDVIFCCSKATNSPQICDEIKVCPIFAIKFQI